MRSLKTPKRRSVHYCHWSQLKFLKNQIEHDDIPAQDLLSNTVTEQHRYWATQLSTKQHSYWVFGHLNQWYCWIAFCIICFLVHGRVNMFCSWWITQPLFCHSAFSSHKNSHTHVSAMSLMIILSAQSQKQRAKRIVWRYKVFQCLD